MRLLNLIPKQPATLEEGSDELNAYVEAVSRFFCQCVSQNTIDDFFVSFSIDLDNSDSECKYPIGMKVSIDDIPSIVEDCIINEFGVRVRSYSCRFFSFGYDYDAWICLKESDKFDARNDFIEISDISEDLIKTDWYDH